MSKSNLNLVDIEVTKSAFDKSKHSFDTEKVVDTLKNLWYLIRFQIVKKLLNNFLEKKIIKESNHYVLCFQKVVDMLNILMNVSICLVCLKMGEILRNGLQDIGNG